MLKNTKENDIRRFFGHSDQNVKKNSDCQFPLYFWAFLLVKLKRFAGDQNDWERKWKFAQDLRMACITISHLCIIIWQLLRKWDTLIQSVPEKNARLAQLHISAKISGCISSIPRIFISTETREWCLCHWYRVKKGISFKR